MASWIERVTEEVDRQYDELPAWKKADDQSTLNCCSEARTSSTIKEPRQE